MKPSLFTRAWSLVEDSDIVPAIALLENDAPLVRQPMASALYEQIRERYPFLFAADEGAALAAHYENYYANCEGPKTGLKFHDIRGTQRFHAIAAALRPMAPGSTVVDWGCAEGSMILSLARELPHLHFYGADISRAEIDALHANAAKIAGAQGIPNFKGGRVVGHNDPSAFGDMKFDIALACEVLEHVPEPWRTLDVVESLVRPGGWVVITTPQGPWELMGCREQGANQWPWRAHVWHLTPEAYMDAEHGMLRFKGGRGCIVMNGAGNKHTIRGHVMVGYRADHKLLPVIDPLWKAGRVNLRPTLAICGDAMYAPQLEALVDMSVPPVAVTDMSPEFYAARPWILDWFRWTEVDLVLRSD